MYARETLVGFPLHVKSPARRRPLLQSKSAAPKRKTPVGVSFFLEQGTGIEPASSAWEADVLTLRICYPLIISNSLPFCNRFFRRTRKIYIRRPGWDGQFRSGRRIFK